MKNDGSSHQSVDVMSDLTAQAEPPATLPPELLPPPPPAVAGDGPVPTVALLLPPTADGPVPVEVPLLPHAAASPQSLAGIESSGASQLSATSGCLSAVGDEQEGPGLGSSHQLSGFSSLSAARSQTGPSRSTSIYPPATTHSTSMPCDLVPIEPVPTEPAHPPVEEAAPAAVHAPSSPPAAIREPSSAALSDKTSTHLQDEPALSAAAEVPPCAALPDSTQQPPDAGSGSQHASGSSTPAAASSPRLSVRQLMEQREREREAVTAAAPTSLVASTPVTAPSPRTASRGLPSTRSQGRLGSSGTSPQPSPRRPATGARAAAAAESRPGTASSLSGHGSSASHLSADRGCTGSSLLRPTASYVAGVEETRSRKELQAQASMPCSFQPQATQQHPFKLSCEERAQYDHMRTGEAAHLTTEERVAQQAARGRQQLERKLRGARERCCRSLSSVPPHPVHGTMPQATPFPKFREFKLHSLERHQAYAASFAAKVEAARRAEEAELGLATHRGSRSPSRIGALHDGGGGGGGTTPPCLATGQRAERHQERSAARAQREREEVAAREMERAARLTTEERAEEEERMAHRFKAREMPDFTVLPIFVPSKSKARPPTVPKGFKFSVRFGEQGQEQAAAPALVADVTPATATSGGRSRSRLRNEGSAEST